MMDRPEKPSRRGLRLLASPVVHHPGMCVTLFVMLLLKGLSGTLSTVADQAVAFASSFLDGGSADLADVLRQTAPLAFSVALIVFAALRNWLPSDARGVFAAAVVILGGAWLGNELRYGGQTIEPLFAASERVNWMGTVYNAASQLGGYLREYQPKLFIASLAVGAYLGWRWNWLYSRIELAINSRNKPPTLKVPRERTKPSQRNAA